jgi:hypothetical protein
MVVYDASRRAGHLGKTGPRREEKETLKGAIKAAINMERN